MPEQPPAFTPTLSSSSSPPLSSRSLLKCRKASSERAIGCLFTTAKSADPRNSWDWHDCDGELFLTVSHAYHSYSNSTPQDIPRQSRFLLVEFYRPSAAALEQVSGLAFECKHLLLYPHGLTASFCGLILLWPTTRPMPRTLIWEERNSGRVCAIWRFQRCDGWPWLRIWLAYLQDWQDSWLARGKRLWIPSSQARY